jgi:NADPH:quinone reductase
MTQSIPTTMRAVVLHEYGGAVTLEQHPVRLPGTGEALVHIAASPINPSDLLFIMGAYGFRKPLPTTPGFEASGTIVAVGEGVSEAMMGQRVAVYAGGEDGAWMEYVRTAASNCIPLPDQIDLERGAMLIANPLTAHLLLDMAVEGQAVVQTAAASVLGKMIIRLAKRRGIEIINIVRREEQVHDLVALGAQHVLNSGDPDFDAQLRGLCHTLKAHLAFDAVGGVLSGQVLRAMPNASRMIVYGALSGQPCAIYPDDLVFRKKRVDGFWLVDWLTDSTPAIIGSVVMDVLTAVDGEYTTEVRARYPLAQVPAALRDYTNQMTGGKVLLVP